MQDSQSNMDGLSNETSERGGSQNEWFIRENPIYKWMMTWGYPHDLGNLHINWSVVWNISCTFP